MFTWNDPSERENLFESTNLDMHFYGILKNKNFERARQRKRHRLRTHANGYEPAIGAELLTDDPNILMRALHNLTCTFVYNSERQMYCNLMRIHILHWMPSPHVRDIKRDARRFPNIVHSPFQCVFSYENFMKKDGK